MATRLCPCGWAGDPSARCRCSGEQIARYSGRISGPLLDRIDVIVEVPRVAPAELRAEAPAGECSAAVKRRVEAARQRQHLRGSVINARLPPSELARLAALDVPTRDLLERAMERMQLSARAAQRILRVARTIADLAGVERIERPHLAEAIGYRRGLEPGNRS